MSYPINTPITYTAEATTPGYSSGDHIYSWRFDDNTSQVGSSIFKTWTNAGSHTATIFAANIRTGGAGTNIKTINIVAPPDLFLNTINASKAFTVAGNTFTALGSSDGQYIFNKLNSDGTTTKIFTGGFLTSGGESAMNNGSVSAAISITNNWIVSCFISGGSVASSLFVLNTSSNALQEFNFRNAINPSYCYPEKSAMIIPKADGNFVVSIYNTTWQVPYTFIYNPTTNTHSNVIGGYAYIDGLALTAEDGYTYLLRKSYGGNTIARYNLVGHSWDTVTLTSTQYDSPSRTSPTSIKMADGKFLLVGGYDQLSSNNAITKIAIFDPVTVTITDKMDMSVARYWPVCSLLSNGNILVAGGKVSFNGVGIASAEIYDPLSNTWTTISSLEQARGEAVISELPSGNFVIIGGINASGTATNTIEYFHPLDNKFYSVD